MSSSNPASPASGAEPLAIGSISLRLYPHDLPPTEQLSTLRAQAAMAANVGYDGVMVSEHHADFPGYLPNPIQLSQLLLDAMPAGWVAPCPLLLPIKPYALIAEDLAWLAAGYPGRVGAGFAAGALPVDFELAEVPFEEIIPRFKAALPRVVAALRGGAEGPLAADRAIARTGEHRIPMVVAAQSPGAARRAARLGLGVLYDSLNPVDALRRLSGAYREAGGSGPAILIRRVWIGDPPTAAMAHQMAHYRSYASEQAIMSWDTDQLIAAPNGRAAADLLADSMHAAGCDTVNVRVHLKGLPVEAVNAQIVQHGDGFLAHLRSRLAQRPGT